MKGFRSHHPPSLDFSWRNGRKPAQKETSELKDGESRTALAIYNFGSTHLLWRVAVHGLQLAMGEGQGGRHIHLAAHDFDVGPGFAGAG